MTGMRLQRAHFVLFLLTASASAAENLALRKLSSPFQTDGAQVVAADQKGNVLLFVDPGRVFAVGLAGPEKELDTPVIEDMIGGGPFRAARSPSGDRWLMSSKSGLLVVDGDEFAEFPTPGPIFSIAFWDDRPILNTLWPPRFADILTEELDDGEAPLAYVLDEDDKNWEPCWLQELGDEESVDPRNVALISTSALMAPDERSRLWVANQYQYRVRRFSSSGRQLLDLRIPDLRLPEHSEEAEARFQKMLDEQGVDRSRVRSMFAAPGVPIIRALAARDGTAYLLWRQEDAPADKVYLDRISSLGEVERAVLHVEDAKKIVSMAVGEDFLFFAPREAANGMYSVSFRTLEAVEWTPVEGIEGGMQPAAADDDAESNS
jgi:hypothetical protein